MDYPQWYKSVSQPFRTERRARMLGALDKGLVALMACAYIAALAGLALTADPRLWRALAVPAATFLLISAVRVAVNRRRPYESHKIDPIVPKATSGKSFPSRHVASAVVISCTLLWLNALSGALALLGSAAICFARIVGGVHYPSDVAAAVAIAAAMSALGFCL